MKFFKVISTHILLIVITVIVMFTVVSFILKSATRHGEALSVPDLNGLYLDDAIEILDGKKLRYMVIDSLFFEDKPKGSIIDQNPSAESKVKEDRIIYLVINSSNAPGVTLPDLTDVSLRQAQAMLKSVGLKTGNLSYKPDIAQNVVLEASIGGRLLQGGEKLPKGSSIDLVLGDGLVDAEDVQIPLLLGLNKEEANNLLINSALNIGAVVFQGTITDSSQAKVVRQYPAFVENVTIKAGQAVDIYLKQE
jgi:beta-lactam-binding protein with PASTA domain